MLLKSFLSKAASQSHDDSKSSKFRLSLQLVFIGLTLLYGSNSCFASNRQCRGVFFQPVGRVTNIFGTQYRSLSKASIDAIHAAEFGRMIDTLESMVSNREWSAFLQAVTLMTALTKTANISEETQQNWQHALLEFGIYSGDIMLPETLTWKNPKTITKKFKKHGVVEFQITSEVVYRNAAINFASRPIRPGEVALQIGEQRRTIKYSAETNELVILENSVVQTYFKLTDTYRPRKEFDQYVGKLLTER